jgi:hypothetical protein
MRGQLRASPERSASFYRPQLARPRTGTRRPAPSDHHGRRPGPWRACGRPPCPLPQHTDLQRIIREPPCLINPTLEQPDPRCPLPWNSDNGRPQGIRPAPAPITTACSGSPGQHHRHGRSKTTSTDRLLQPPADLVDMKADLGPGQGDFPAPKKVSHEMHRQGRPLSVRVPPLAAQKTIRPQIREGTRQ